MNTQGFLYEQWLKLCARSSANQDFTEFYWQEITSNHSEPNRHYHNLQHLEELFRLLLPFESKVEHPQAVYWAIFFHDIIYKSLRKDNELKSAELADVALKKLEVDTEIIQLTYSLILATKDHHAMIPSNDFRYFLDADLAILGADWKKYETYYKAIRQEYRHVPNILYRRGRKKVLQHLLQKAPLYDTPEFFERFEAQARANIKMELKLL